MMNKVPATQTPENRNIDPFNPSVSIKSGKNFSAKNEHNESSIMQNDTPKSFKIKINTIFLKWKDFSSWYHFYLQIVWHHLADNFE